MNLSDLATTTKGSSNITVSWIQPSGGAIPTGYVVYFEAMDGGADSGSETVANSSATQLVISGRNRASYDISMVVTSAFLPSTVVGPVSTEGEWLSFH